MVTFALQQIYLVSLITHEIRCRIKFCNSRCCTNQRGTNDIYKSVQRNLFYKKKREKNEKERREKNKCSYEIIYTKRQERGGERERKKLSTFHPDLTIRLIHPVSPASHAQRNAKLQATSATRELLSRSLCGTILLAYQPCAADTYFHRRCLFSPFSPCIRML